MVGIKTGERCSENLMKGNPFSRKCVASTLIYVFIDLPINL